MADYFPLIANPVGNLITELPANNNLNLANSSIINAVSVQSVGNITGNYFIGNGSLLTGIDATSIQNGTSNVRVVSAGGNVAVGINGTSNVVVTANTGVYVTGLVSATGQVTGSQFNGSGAGLSSIPGANVTGTVPAATVAATVTTAAQPNITSVGTLTSLAVTGNITGGNILTSGTAGNITGANVIIATTLSATSNVISGNLKTGNITIDTDTIRSANTTLTLDPAADGVSGLVVIAGNLQVTGTTTTIDSTVVTVNDLMINVANNAATSAAANGGGLGVGPVGTEYVKLYWDSSGNTWDSTHGISAVGTVTATSFVGSGAGLTSITGANVTGTVPAATSATTAGTVTTAAQPNITSVGTLSSVTVTGNIVGGNVNSTFFGSGAGLSSLTGANVTGTVPSASNASTVGGFTPSQTAGTASRVVVADVNGYINNNYFNSSDNAVTSGVTAVMVKSGDNFLRSGSPAAVASFISGQSMDISGSATSASSATLASTVTINYNNDSNSSYQLLWGSGTSVYGTAGVTVNPFTDTITATLFSGKATSAQYADLAEKYTADADYEPGTVLIFGGDQEVTMSTADAQRQVVGVVSTNPAYVMNSELEHKFVATVALTGRTPVKVIGPVRKGDFMVSAANGYACASADPKLGTVIGKAIENFDGDTGVIEVLINNH